MFCTSKERETCGVEKMGCNGCYYNKLLAKGDITYCIKDCKEKCSKHKDNYVFNEKIRYSFTNKCIK